MALFLEGVEGPALGQKFQLVAGLRIGRITGEIQLSDPKVSALHAQVERSEKGQFYLGDRGSSNGIRINGQRAQRIALLPGVRLQVGRSFFKVTEVAFKEPYPEPALQPTAGQEWIQTLRTQVSLLAVHNRTHESQVQRFNSLIELNFLEGPQAETQLVLGYGPRKFGSDVLDIELEDPQSPDIAFELFPTPDGKVLLRTAHPEIVSINSDSVSSEVLNTGDLIRIGTTLIEVKFIE